jgi:hypothetical protein
MINKVEVETYLLCIRVSDARYIQVHESSLLTPVDTLGFKEIDRQRTLGGYPGYT